MKSSRTARWDKESRPSFYILVTTEGPPGPTLSLTVVAGTPRRNPRPQPLSPSNCKGHSHPAVPSFSSLELTRLSHRRRNRLFHAGLAQKLRRLFRRRLLRMRGYPLTAKSSGKIKGRRITLEASCIVLHSPSYFGSTAPSSQISSSKYRGVLCKPVTSIFRRSAVNVRTTYLGSEDDEPGFIG